MKPGCCALSSLSSRRGSLQMEATMRPLRATVLRPACPATSSASDNGRPLSRPPLYSPHWPIVPPCPDPRPIRSSEGAARHCARLLARSAAGSVPGPGAWTRANCEAGALRGPTAAHSLFSGESCTRISGGLEPGLDGTIVSCSST